MAFTGWELLIPNLEVKVLDPVLCRGYPREADFEALEHLAATIVDKHRELGLDKR